MNPIASYVFEFTSPAGAQQVWAALTRPDLTPRYLFGLRVESTWRTGATVEARPAGEAGAYGSLRGEVLAAEEPRRLSYSLLSGDDHPRTYLTWEITAGDDGSRVRLYVDEAETDSGDDEADAAWRSVVAALQAVLSGLSLA